MEAQYISSEENKIIKQINSLKMRKQRKKLGKFIVEGYRVIADCLSSNSQIIDFVVFSSSAIESLEGKKLFKTLMLNHKVFEVPDKLFKKITETENPQGMLAVVSMIDFKLDTLLNKEDNSIFVILDRIQDPGNMGTIIRTAVAINAKAVILTKGSVDPYNSKTVRSTMGAVFNIPIIEIEDNSWVTALKENNIRLIGSTLDTQKSYLQIDYSGGLGIIIGNEANGIDPQLLEKVDEKVYIPIIGNIESLNASVAAGVLLYKAIEHVHK